jgi:hypothetical protein
VPAAPGWARVPDMNTQHIAGSIPARQNCRPKYCSKARQGPRPWNPIVHRWSRGSAVSPLTPISADAHSRQSLSRSKPKNRQVRLVYRCWNFAGKSHFVSLWRTLRVPSRRPRSRGMSLQQQKIGPEARPPESWTEHPVGGKKECGKLW